MKTKKKFISLNPDNLDRREFLKKSSLAAASASFIPMLGKSETDIEKHQAKLSSRKTKKIQLPEGAELIKRTGDELILDTQAGAVLKMSVKPPFGIGQFIFNNEPLGDEIPYFFRQDSQDVIYRASETEILEETENEVAIRFSGDDQHFRFEVTLRIRRGVPSFYFHIHIPRVLNAVHNKCCVDLPVKLSNQGFIQRPFDGPVAGDYQGKYYILPDLVTVPLLFSGSGEQDELFTGLGYQLSTEWITQGKLEYDSCLTHPLRVYLPYNYYHKPWGGRIDGKREKPAEYEVKFIYALGNTQTEMIKAYKSFSGFTTDTEIYRDTKTAMDGVYKCYRNIQKGYTKGKGYHMKIDPADGDLIGYGRFVCPSYGPHMSYLLYDYWTKNKNESWARERAVEMVDYYMDNQQENGAVPQLFNTEKNEFAGFGDYYTLKGFPYNTCHFSIGTYGLLKFADLMEKAEGKNVKKYRKSAFRGVDYVASRIEENGLLGRSFSKDDEYDKLTAEVWALIMLDHASTYTGKEHLSEKRDLLERFTVETFVKPNIWKNWSSDSVWSGGGDMPPNWDNFSALAFTSYCMRRHHKTGEDRYIDLAEHSFWYNWLASIPVNKPGYKHITKGLSREQDVNELFNPPIRTCNLVDGIPYLSEVTGDPFYVEYFRMMLQTYYFYQAIDTDYPGFWEALRVSSKELGGFPRDQVQPDGITIVEWTCMYWDMVISELWMDSVEIDGRTYHVDK